MGAGEAHLAKGCDCVDACRDYRRDSGVAKTMEWLHEKAEKSASGVLYI